MYREMKEITVQMKEQEKSKSIYFGGGQEGHASSAFSQGLQHTVTSLPTETTDRPLPGGVSQPPVFSVRRLPQSSVCLQGKQKILKCEV